MISRKRTLLSRISQRLYALYDAGIDKIVDVISPLKDSEREERIALEILASL